MRDQATVEELQRELAHSRRLVEASNALQSTLDLDELLGLILEAAQSGTDADRGTVFLLSEDGTQLWSRVMAGDGSFEIRLPVGQGIAGTVASTGETVRLEDAHADPRFDSSWDKKSGYVTRQLLTAPIRRRDGSIAGVFQLLNKKSEGDFDEEDERFLEQLSIPASLAVENARLHRSALEKERQDREILLVQSIQRAYQPERAQVEVGRLLASGMNQLCEDASGDYYDFVELPSGRLCLVVGDVSGHGLGAALVMAQARAFLRAFAETVDQLASVMNLLNDFLSRDMTGGRFMTMFVGIVDPATGQLEWTNAGHPPGFLYRAATGEVEELESQRRVLGVFANAGFEPTPPVELGSGDVLLLYTDGVTEAQNAAGELLEEAGLRELLRGAAALAPEGILEAVRQAVVDWTGATTFEDDLTLIALKAS